MKFKQSSWEAAMSTLMDFEHASGMRINYDKTSVYRLGSICDTDARFYTMKKIRWTNDPVNILGSFCNI